VFVTLRVKEELLLLGDDEDFRGLLILFVERDPFPFGGTSLGDVGGGMARTGGREAASV
jgi:hypothetical protein